MKDAMKNEIRNQLIQRSLIDIFVGFIAEREGWVEGLPVLPAQMNSIKIISRETYAGGSVGLNPTSGRKPFVKGTLPVCGLPQGSPARCCGCGYIDITSRLITLAASSQGSVQHPAFADIQLRPPHKAFQHRVFFQSFDFQLLYFRFSAKKSDNEAWYRAPNLT